MQFSGSDLIVIAIVVAILLVYRHLDRNNRSLEKLKRFADRVHDELDAHVQQKVVAIKDMGIELEVHQTAAKEVLRRVQAIEQGLNNRSDDIERIGTRIGEYDRALDELVKMTERAEENIQRIKEESSYVDSVGKRIRQSQDRLTQVEKQLSGIADQFATENAARLSDVEANALAHTKSSLAELRDEVSGFQERIDQFGEYVRGAEERAEHATDHAKVELEEILQTVINRAQEATIQSSEQITDLREQLDTMESDYHKRLLSLAERGEAMETEALSKLRERIDESAQQTSRELSSRLDSNKRAFLEHVQSGLTEIKRAEEALIEHEKRITATREELDAKVGSFRQELSARIDAAGEEAQRATLAGIEGRLADYESQMTYRIEQLGDVGHDIEQLEARLQDAMSQVKASVREEFAQFVAEFRESRDRQRGSFDSEMSELRDAMGALESGLTDLKNAAYENVAAKLQVFEDDFFSDLRERQVSMEQRLVDWQAAFQEEIETVAADGRSDRARIEEGYSEELKRRLESLQSNAYGTYEQIEESIVEFQRGIELRVSDSRELIASLERQIEEEIQQLSTDAKSGLRTRFAEHREQMATELKQLDRTVRAQLEDLEKSFVTRRTELEAELETGRGEARAWKAQVDQLLSATITDVNQQIADARVAVGETISELREQFASDRDDAIADQRVEQERVRRDLDDLSDQVVRITDDIRSRSAEALSEFGERYSTLRSDTERQVKSMSSDVDARIKEFRSVVQDSREQFAASQEKLMAKLNEEANALGSNLQEIDRRTRSFVDQTRIFERADSLKEELAREIGSLKEDLSRVDEQRKDVREIEAQFTRLRKSADDVNEKMTRFVAEKRRIDALEDDYKKLLSMSQAVELKLDHVTSSNDSLQQVQAALRGLDDLQKDVEGRFQRLEKKRSILDLTTEGVDKSFQTLQEIESRLSDVSAQIDAVPGQVEELTGRIATLAANRRDADAAVKQLALLDQTLEQIEERMENLNQAREWLARTETRLEEVQREAEEQVKLLGAILKQEGKSPKGRDSAPPVNTRDTVIKLARQSWNVDEIARATSLSRGEVELILELSAK